VLLANVLTFIKTYWKQLLLVALGVFAALNFQSCYHKVFPPKPPVTSTPLPPDVKYRVTVKGDTVIVQTPTSTKTTTGVRGGVLDITNDGKINLKVQDKGWETRFGLNGYIGSEGGAFGVDFRPFYWKRLDLMLGAGYMPKSEQLDCWLGVGYTPTTAVFSNTTIFVGYSVRKSPVAGVSVRF